MPMHPRTTLTNPNDTLERQNEKLRLIADVLIRHAEEMTEDRGAAYAQFQRAAMLEEQVRDRTRDLERALDLLNASNARLASANRETEQARLTLASAIETIQEGFALFDANDVLVLCNSRFNALLPDIRSELTPGLRFSDYLRIVSASDHLGLDGSTKPEQWVAMRQRRHAEQRYIFNQRMGEDRWVQVSEHRTHDGGTVILQTEVTELIKSEREERGKLLDDQARMLRATLDHLRLGICIFDPRLHLAGWNERLSEFITLPQTRLGMDFEILLEQIRLEYTFPNGLSAHRFSDWVRRVKRRDSFSIEVTRGRNQTFELYAQELPDGGFVMSLSDISAEREALRALARINETLEARVLDRTLELEDALARAERANASRARFVAAASHDLLQPLSAAKLYLASLADEITEPLQIRTLDKAQNALGSVEDILGALLDISRLESGHAAVTVEPIALGPMFRQLADEYAPSAALKGIALKILPTDAVVHSDRAYLRRILQNLISNAIRYTDKGRVLVGTRRRDGTLAVEVRDSGPGIPEEHQDLIFREFHRVNAKASASEGMGLGLAIVERAAALLGHPLELRSRVGLGTTFAIGFGKARPSEVIPERAPSRRNTTGSDGTEAPRPVDINDMLILLVENDEELSRAMVLLLEKWGATVFDVPSGEDALELLDATGVEPELCLIDYQLGAGMNGLDCLTRLRERLGDIPARIVTADRTPELHVRAAAINAQILSKPIQTEALEDFVISAKR